MRQGETKKISIPKRGGAVIIIYIPRKIKFSTSSANKADNNRENSNGRENSRQNSRESSVDTTTSSSYNGTGLAPLPDEPKKPVTPGVLRTIYHDSSDIIISTNT